MFAWSSRLAQSSRRVICKVCIPLQSRACGHMCIALASPEHCCSDYHGAITSVSRKQGISKASWHAAGEYSTATFHSACSNVVSHYVVDCLDFMKIWTLLPRLAHMIGLVGKQKLEKLFLVFCVLIRGGIWHICRSTRGCWGKKMRCSSQWVRAGSIT